MENASNALMMAGGVLIALIIVGAFLLMFNSVSNYTGAESDELKSQQLASFNTEFDTYDRENVLGSDVLTVVNKANEYNAKSEPVQNSVDYKEIKIDIDFGKDKPYGGELFINRKYNNYNNNTITTLLKAMLDLDKSVGNSGMNKLSSNYESIWRFWTKRS